MNSNGFNYEDLYNKKRIEIDKRNKGKQYNYSEHLKSLILAQLKNNRLDNCISNKFLELNDIFNEYNKDFILSKDKEYYLEMFKEINCSNNMINKIIEGKYKLKQVGYSVAVDYLIGVGVEANNISSSSLKLFDKTKLNILNPATRERGIALIEKLSEINYLDKIETEMILKYFTNPKYSNICAEHPKCFNCKLKGICNR